MQQIICARRCHAQAAGKLLRPGMPSMLRRICKYATHLRLIRPMELEVALPKSHRQNFCAVSPWRNSSELYQYVLGRTPRLARSAYYWGWN
ncbi:MAG: hypothetical protein ACLVJH_08785 [Faecalibacterium prausnitzii]